MKFYLKPFFLLIGMSLTVNGAIRMNNNPQSVEVIRLTAKVTKEKFSRGEAISVNLSVINNLKRTVVLSESTPDKDYELDLKDTNGRSVLLTKYGKQIKQSKGVFKRILVNLKHGQSVECTIDISKLFDITTTGSYSLTVSRSVLDSRTNRWISIKSNTIQITIL